MVTAPGALPADPRRQPTSRSPGTGLRRSAVPTRRPDLTRGRAQGTCRVRAGQALGSIDLPPPSAAEDRADQSPRWPRVPLGRGTGRLLGFAHRVHRHRLRGSARLRTSPCTGRRPSRLPQCRSPACLAAFTSGCTLGDRAEEAPRDVQEGRSPATGQTSRPRRTKRNSRWRGDDRSRKKRRTPPRQKTTGGPSQPTTRRGRRDEDAGS